MYMGVVKTVFDAFSLTDNYLFIVLTYAVTPFLAPIAAWVGYTFGVHRPIVNNKEATKN